MEALQSGGAVDLAESLQSGGAVGVPVPLLRCRKLVAVPLQSGGGVTIQQKAVVGGAVKLVAEPLQSSGGVTIWRGR